jgi:hypothetical protein
MSTDEGCQEGISLYLLARKGYSLLTWTMTSFKEETLYNKKHQKGQFVVENAFRIMKENWRRMLNKTILHVALVSNVGFYIA